MSEKPQRRVVCAAIRNAITGVIVCGARHFDTVMRAQIATNVAQEGWKAPDNQGFIDQWGVFMNRQEALAVALSADQRIRRCGGDDHKLYSENLY